MKAVKKKKKTVIGHLSVHTCYITLVWMCIYVHCRYSCMQVKTVVYQLWKHLKMCRYCPVWLFLQRSFSFPQPSLARFNKKTNYSSCPLISKESFFPGWKHCHPFFSLHNVPSFPPFLSVSNDCPRGNWAQQQNVSGEPAGDRPEKLSPPLPALSIPPTSCLFDSSPSHHSTLALHLCAS